MSKDADRLQFYSLDNQLLTEVEEKEYSLFIFTFIRRATFSSIIYWLYLLSLGILTVSLINSHPISEFSSRYITLSLIGALCFQLVLGSTLHQIIQLGLFKLNINVHFKIRFSFKRLSMMVYYPENIFLQKTITRNYSLSFIITAVLPVLIAIILRDTASLFLIAFALFQTLYCMKDFSILSYFEFKKASGLMFGGNGKNILIFRKKPTKMSL